MTTQMNKPLTIKEYAASQGLSETTVRRRIRAGGLDARLEHGRYFIYGQNGDHSREKANTQNGKEDMQFGQANDHVDSHELHADSPESNGQQPLIDRLTSEVDYLRDQLDKQTQLLAASTAQNNNMVQMLNSPPQTSWLDRIRTRFFATPSKSDS